MERISLRKNNCKNCYKCLRKCPVYAISMGSGSAQVEEESCIYCGNCVLACPHEGAQMHSDLPLVRQLVEQGEKVWVSLDSAFVAAFPGVSFRQLEQGLLQLGFAGVEETSVGAYLVCRRYEKELAQRQPDCFITTFCPGVVALAEKYYPDLLPMLAGVVTPPKAHGRLLKQQDPERKVVYAGPCLARMPEKQADQVLDGVLMFHELKQWLEETNALPSKEQVPPDAPALQESTYPVPGGVMARLHVENQEQYRTMVVDGPQRCMEVLEGLRTGQLHHRLIEMSLCRGGCVGGLSLQMMGSKLFEAQEQVEQRTRWSRGVEDTGIPLEQFFENKKPKREPCREEEIRQVLRAMGKTTPKQELNCGSCGYDTCRALAKAVVRHQADIRMCLPYMRQRAESTVEAVINNSSNGILIMDKNLTIVRCNRAAEGILKHIHTGLVGRQMDTVLPCDDLEEVRNTQEDMVDEKRYYQDYGLVLEQSIIYLEKSNSYMMIFKDITNEENQSEKIRKAREDTVAVAQKVIEKQMRVAQEIASLLGETTAETKVALNRLKKSILEDQ